MSLAADPRAVGIMKQELLVGEPEQKTVRIPENINAPDFLPRLRELVETKLSPRRGRVADSAVTYRDLFAMGMLGIIDDQGRTQTGSGTPGVVPVGGTDPAVDDVAPEAPTGLAAAAAFRTVQLQWNAPADPDKIGYAEIFANAVDNLGTAVKLGASLSTFFVDEVNAVGVGKFYWVRFVNRIAPNLVGPYNGTAGTFGQTGRIGNVDLGPLIVEAANLATGAVTASKLAAQAVEYTAFANGIEPVGVVAILPPPSGYVGPRTVLLTSDGKLYRYVAGAWTRATDGADLVANSVTTGAIAAGAINAGQIAAGAIRAQHILVAPKSLNFDPDFQLGGAGWTSFVARLPTTDPSVPAGCPYPFAASFKSRDDPCFAKTAVKPGEQYRISVMLAPGTFTGDVGLVVHGHDITGAPAAIYAAGAPVATWTRFEATVTIPSWAVTISIGPWLNQGFGVAPFAWFTDLNWEKLNSAELIVDGAIIASKLAANSIAVGTAAIQNGAIVNAMIANATIDDAKIANLNAAKITAGFLDVARIQAGTIDASKINVTALSAISANIGTITAGSIHGVTLHGGTFTSAYAWPASGNGFHLSASGLLLGNATTGPYFQANANGDVFAPGLTITAGAAVFAGALSAATGTFAGNLSAAGGTFAGALSAATGTFAGTLTAAAVNAVDTINIAGQAVTVSTYASSGSGVSAVAGAAAQTILTCGSINVGASGTVCITASINYASAIFSGGGGDSGGPGSSTIPTYQIRRNGTAIATWTPYGNGDGTVSVRGDSTFTVLDTPGAAAVYTLVHQCNVSGSPVPIGEASTIYRTLICLGTKR